MNESNLVVRKSRRLRRVSNHGRRSSLPDSILGHILLYLPTKYAMATSIPFSRWKLVWTLLHNLCFDDRLCLRPSALIDVAVARFEKFVYIVLLRFDRANIDKFSFHCPKLTALFSIKFWVSSTIMHNVREIELDLKYQYCIELPESIYTSKTLEVIKLDSDLSSKYFLMEYVFQV